MVRSIPPKGSTFITVKGKRVSPQLAERGVLENKFGKHPKPGGKALQQKPAEIWERKKPPLESQEPQADIFNEGEAYSLLFDMVGIEEDSIKLNISNSKLKISAKSPHRIYKGEYPLPNNVNPDSMSWRYHNGILEVKFLKREKNA